MANQYTKGDSSLPPSAFSKIPHEEAKQQLAMLKNEINRQDIEKHLALLTQAITDSVLKEDAYHCIRLFIKTSDETQILKVLNHLNKELIKCNNVEKENFVYAFKQIIEVLEQRNDVVVKVVNSFIPSLLNNIRMETAETIATILSIHTRFFSNPQLRNRVYMFHIGEYFCIGESLGKGTSGHVYKGFHKGTGTIVAIKQIPYFDKSFHYQAALRREIEMMKFMNHPNIIRLYDAVKDDRYLYLILEYSCIGDLEKYIQTKTGQRLTLEESHHFMQEIAKALKFLRSRNIVHRDLKTENFLVFCDDDGTMRLKLSDFTSARILHEGELTMTDCGTPLYMAPEIFENKKYTDKADLWSVGVIMYRLIFNKLPYIAKSRPELATIIRTTSLQFPSDCEISDESKDLLLGLLNKDPYQRITWEKFFTHPYFSTSQKSHLLTSHIPNDPNSVGFLEAQVKKFKDAFLTAQQQVYTLENQLKEAHERELKLEQTNQDLCQREDQLRRENENLFRKIQEFEMERSSSSSNAAQQEENKTKTTENATYKEQPDLRELQSELEKTTNEITHLTKKIQQLELDKNESNKILQDHKNKYKAQILRLTKHNEELEKQLAEVSMHRDTLLNLVKKSPSSAEFEKLVKEKQRLEEELKSYRLKDAEIQSLQTILAKQTKEREELQLKLQTLTTAIEVYQKKEQEQTEQLNQLMKEYNKTLDQFQLSEETVSLLREELKKAEEEITHLHQELTQIRSRLNGAKK